MMYRRAPFLIALLLGLVLTLPTLSIAEEISFETTPLSIITSDGNRHDFTVEIAATQAQRARGLMFREELAADQGMLFDYQRDLQASMWMKNTLIPLDMLFIDRNGIIKNLRERTVPHSLEPVQAKSRVRGVLELAGGTVSRLGIRPGDRVLHPIFGSP